MAECSAIKPNGERCQRSADGQHGLCWAHDPTNAERRQRIARRGGKARGPSHELVKIKALLEELTERVLGAEGKDPLETGPAAVANQVINTRLRAIELERKIREQDDVLERIAALEEQDRGQQRGRYGTWGR